MSGSEKSMSAITRQRMKERNPEMYEAYLQKQKQASRRRKQRREEYWACGTRQALAAKEAFLKKGREADRKCRAKSKSLKSREIKTEESRHHNYYMQREHKRSKPRKMSGSEKSRSTIVRQRMKERNPEMYEAYLQRQQQASRRRKQMREEYWASGTTQALAHKEAFYQNQREATRKSVAKIRSQQSERPINIRPDPRTGKIPRKYMSAEERRKHDLSLKRKRLQSKPLEQLAAIRKKRAEFMRLYRQRKKDKEALQREKNRLKYWQDKYAVDTMEKASSFKVCIGKTNDTNTNQVKFNPMSKRKDRIKAQYETPKKMQVTPEVQPKINDEDQYERDSARDEEIEFEDTVSACDEEIVPDVSACDEEIVHEETKCFEHLNSALSFDDASRKCAAKSKSLKSREITTEESGQHNSLQRKHMQSKSLKMSYRGKSRSTIYRQRIKEVNPEMYEAYLQRQRHASERKKMIREEYWASGTKQALIHKEAFMASSREATRKSAAKTGKHNTSTKKISRKYMSAEERREHVRSLRRKRLQSKSSEQLAAFRKNRAECMRLYRQRKKDKEALQRESSRLKSCQEKNAVGTKKKDKPNASSFKVSHRKTNDMNTSCPTNQVKLNPNTKKKDRIKAQIEKPKNPNTKKKDRIKAQIEKPKNLQVTPEVEPKINDEEEYERDCVSGEEIDSEDTVSACDEAIDPEDVKFEEEDRPNPERRKSDYGEGEEYEQRVTVASEERSDMTLTIIANGLVIKRIVKREHIENPEDEDELKTMEVKQGVVEEKSVNPKEKEPAYVNTLNGAQLFVNREAKLREKKTRISGLTHAIQEDSQNNMSYSGKSMSSINRLKMKERNPEKYEAYLQKQRQAMKRRKQTQKEYWASGTKQALANKEAFYQNQRDISQIKRLLSPRNETSDNIQIRNMQRKYMTAEERRQHDNSRKRERRQSKSLQKRIEDRKKAAEVMRLHRLRKKMETATLDV